MAKSLGSIARDANNIALPIALGIKTKDISGTPKSSPLTVSSSVLTLAVPTNAVKLILYSTSNDVRVSDLSDTSAYFVLKASTLLTLDIAGTDNIYVVRDGASDATLQFLFQTL